MAGQKSKKVEREEGGNIETKIIKFLDLPKLGDAIAKDTPRVRRKITDSQDLFEQIYLGQQKQAGYTIDAKASEEAGTTVYKITGINDELKVDEITDRFAIFFARRHNQQLAKRMEDALKKLEDGKFDSEKDEDYVSIQAELRSARAEVRQLGFDWEAVKKALGQRGLTEQLKSQIKESYGQQALQYEGSKFLDLIEDSHKGEVAKYLKGKHKHFVQYKLESLELPELKAAFAGTHSLYDVHKGEDKSDLLDLEMHDQFKHLYRINAAKPELKKTKGYHPGAQHAQKRKTG